MSEKGGKERIAKKSGEIITRMAGKALAPKGEKEVGKEGEGGGKKTAEKANVQRGEKPDRKPFWKRVSFGAAEVEDAGADDKMVTRKEGRGHSVPEQGQAPDVFTHERGK